MKIRYVRPLVDYKKRRKSTTIPDQSMSIQEIVKRFVKGVPVDVLQRTPVYVDQSEYDLEKLARMDFGDKAELAQALADDAQRMQSEAKERAMRANEERAKKAQAEASKGAATAPSIVTP